MKMNKIKLVTIIILCMFGAQCFSDPIGDILQLLENINGNSNVMVSDLGHLKDYENDIDQMTKQLNKNITSYMTGHYGYGTLNFHDLQSYGNDSQTWSSVLNMVGNGGSSSALGNEVNQISNQFPINDDIINKTISDPVTQKYYALQAKTVLASRAASQLDFDKIQKQISYQQTLQQQIEKTNDIKAALDLLSRIQVEGNLIQLEVLRQTALTNQQQAVSTQADLNDSVLNAHFLRKPEE